MRRLGLVLAYALFLVALGEGAARLYLRLRLQVPWLRPERTLEAFYPELAPVLRGPTAPDAEHRDVLLLGGSVLHPDWGPVEELLRARLATSGARLHNLARPAQLSRDSLLKYRRLAELPFDVLVLYHGINDARANGAPPAVFRDDYAHFSWFHALNGASRCRESRWALCYAARLAWPDVAQRLHPERFVPLAAPRRAWAGYGGALRSVEPFRRHLEEIVVGSEQRGTPVVLMSFAYYVPSDYSLARFRAGALDYGGHRSPIELWGRPAHVVAALEAHNAVLAELAARHPHVRFVDQQAAIPHDGRHFQDVCHLTRAGAERFVENLLPALLPAAPGAGAVPAAPPAP